MGGRLTHLNERLAKIAGAVREEIPILIYVAGLAVFSVGVGMIYVPAGLMVAGGTAAASAVLYVRGSTSTRRRQ